MYIIEACVNMINMNCFQTGLMRGLLMTLFLHSVNEPLDLKFKVMVKKWL